MNQKTLRLTMTFVVALALWPTTVTTVAAQDGSEVSAGAMTGSRIGTDYRAAVASRGPLLSLADLPSMTQQAWAELQSIGQADADDRVDLFRLTTDVSPSLTTEQRAEVRSQLASSYLDHPEVLASLSADDFCLLIDACWDVGVSNTLIGETIQARLDTAGYSQFTQAEDLRVLLRALKYMRSDEARQAKKQLVDHLWGNLLTDQSYLRDQDAWELFKLIQTTGSQITPQRGQQFAEFYMGYLFEAGDAPTTVGPVELLTAGRSLDVARKTLEGKGYPRYAKALAKAIVDDRVFNFKFTLDYRYLASPLGTDETRQAIRDVLIDDKGLVRLEAAKILGWAYFRTGELQVWEQFLDDKIANSEGDAEALWLLARSHCEEVKYPQGSPLAGRRWVDSALSRAESEEAKLVCVQWLMDRYENARYFDQASEFLASIESGLESGESKRILSALAVRLGRAKTSDDIYNARKKERETGYRLTQRIKTLRGRIEDAEASGKSPYEINKLNAMLDRAEQELAALGR